MLAIVQHREGLLDDALRSWFVGHSIQYQARGEATTGPRCADSARRACLGREFGGAELERAMHW
jgi:hypothetical protein